MILASASAVAAPAPVPGRVAYDRYSRDLWSLPGLASAGWSRATPDAVNLRFVNDGFRRLADNVLRDVVDGVRLLLTVQEGAPAPVPGGDTWADNPTEMARVVSGMPGIFDTRSEREHGAYTYTFSTYDPDTSVRLKALVNDHFAGRSVGFWTRPLPKPPA